MTTDVQIIAVNAQPTPLDYVVAGAQEIVPKAVYASFDGSGAGGDFLPVLQIISDSGHIVASCPAAKVAAGASADVTWFPRVAGNTQVAGDGIKFDTLNVGDWLDIETTGAGPSGFAIRIATEHSPIGDIHIDSGHDVLIDAQSFIDLRTPSNIDLLSQAAGSIITIEQDGGGGEIRLVGDGANVTALTVALGTDHLGFFGTPPVAQPATPVTLGDVIAALQTLGLVN